jgi:7-cyano-7-deazaguanine synthase
MTAKKAFVLLSGGMDSTTCLHKAIMEFAPCPKDELEIRHDGVMRLDTERNQWINLNETGGIDWVEAISVDYGQRHIKESQYAAETCEKFGIDHKVLNIQGLLSGKGVMLADASVPIPNIDYADIKGVSPTYVPYRNGTLLSLITAHAQKWVNNQITGYVEHAGETTQSATNMMRDSVGIYFGAHSEDAANWAYPDCTPEFIGAQANAIYTGSYYAIRLYTPLQWLMKDEIVTLGEKLNVDWKNTWSCYAGGDNHCGTCPTCRSRRSAFVKAGVNDPTRYAA